MTYGFVYMTINTINNKKYIGAHRGSEQDGYLGSGKLLLKALKKYGKEVFEQTIIAFAESEDELFDLEKKFIDEYNAVEDKNFYNTTAGGKNPVMFGEDNPFYGKTHDENARKIISEANKGKVISERHKLAITEKLKGRKMDLSEEERENRSKRTKELWKNEEHRKKMSEIDHTMTEETKQKLSITQKDRFSKEENLLKLRECQQNRNNDAYRTEEFKEEARKRRIEFNKSERKKEINRINQLGKPLSEQRRKNISEALKARNKRLRDGKAISV